MATKKEAQIPFESLRGLEIEIRAAHAHRPNFEPVVKKISAAVREITGTNCAEQVAAKLRW